MEVIFRTSDTKISCVIRMLWKLPFQICCFIFSKRILKYTNLKFPWIFNRPNEHKSNVGIEFTQSGQNKKVIPK